MRWKNRQRSSNVEDRRGRPSGKKAVVGGGGGLVLIIAIVAFLITKDPNTLAPVLEGAIKGGGGGQTSSQPYQPSAAEEELKDFVSVVLADTEIVWNELFARSNQKYQEPKLVMFTDLVQSGCGKANAGMGPFYCPADHKVYIDLSFYDDLKKRHGAPGDFAQAYVIAHEVGHHIQNILGLSMQVQRQRGKISEEAYNRLSVRLELQADFLAGVWAHHADKKFSMLERGDVDEALNAASQIGDDTLQKQATGYVQPEKFTHGTAAQRVRWFKEGLVSGDIGKMKELFDLPYERL